MGLSLLTPAALTENLLWLLPGVCILPIQCQAGTWYHLMQLWCCARVRQAHTQHFPILTIHTFSYFLTAPLLISCVLMLHSFSPPHKSSCLLPSNLQSDLSTQAPVIHILTPFFCSSPCLPSLLMLPTSQPPHTSPVLSPHPSFLHPSSHLIPLLTSFLPTLTS